MYNISVSGLGVKSNVKWITQHLTFIYHLLKIWGGGGGGGQMPPFAWKKNVAKAK